MTIKERIYDHIERQLDIERAQIRDDQEEDFEMDISDEASMKCPTVGDAVRAIEAEWARRGRAST